MSEDDRSFADLLAHFGARVIAADDVIGGMTGWGCMVVWPSGYWPEVETMLARHDVLRRVGEWAACPVIGELVRLRGDEFAIVCHPLVGSTARVDPRMARRMPRSRLPRDLLPFGIPISPFGFSHPFQFLLVSEPKGPS